MTSFALFYILNLDTPRKKPRPNYFRMNWKDDTFTNLYFISHTIWPVFFDEYRLSSIDVFLDFAIEV